MKNNHTKKEIAVSVLKSIFSPSDVKKFERLRGVIMCGLPGCGKSTIAELLSDAYGFEVLSTDQIRTKEMFKHQGHRRGSHKEVMLSRYIVYGELANRVNKKLNDKKKVVVDGTNMDQKRFGILGSMLSKVPSKKVAMILIRTPEWILKKRFEDLTEKEYVDWRRIYKYWVNHVKKGEASFPKKKELSNIQIIKPRRYAIRTFDWVTDIKAIVWDVDMCLYDERKAKIGVYFDKLNIDIVTQKTGWKRDKVVKEFYKRYKKLHSKTKVIDSFGMDGKEEISKVAPDIKYEDFLKKDKRLMKVFRQLNHLDHFIYTNQRIRPTEKKLKIMGLNPRIFKKILGNYDMGFNSKTETSFKKVMKEVGYKPGEVMMVGDRHDQDIVPAKNIGMHTCLVWGVSKEADVSLKTDRKSVV